MARPAEHDLWYYQGDDEEWVLRFSHPDGSPMAVDTGLVAAQVREGPADESPDVVAEFSVSAGASGNEAVLGLSAAQTLVLGGGTFLYDVQIADAAGMVRTWLRGRLRGVREVTRR